MDNQEYIIISKTATQKRIEELEKLDKNSEKPSIQGTLYYKLIKELKQVLSQSTPLIPEIEKAYIQGCLDFQMNGKEFTNGDEQDYISNLKLDI